MSTLNQAIVNIRSVIARAGEADRLSWWPSKIYSTHKNFMEQIFPKTHQAASYKLISHGVRRRDETIMPSNRLLGLFHLGAERETVLAQTAPDPLAGLLDRNYESGTELATALLDAYLPKQKSDALAAAEKLTVNEAKAHIEVSQLSKAHLDEQELERLMGLLVAALRFSSHQGFVPPVARIARQ